MDGMEYIDVIDVDESYTEPKSTAGKQLAGDNVTSAEEITNGDIATPLPRLLQLPVELLQLVLRYTNVASFFISLSTCKQFRNAATSRPLLYYKLKSLPGLILGLEELTTEELLHLFQRRAAESGQAAGILANVSHYKADSWSLMARSALSRHEHVRPHPKYTTLAVPSKDGSIQLFEITKWVLRKRELLYIHHEDGNPGRVRCLKTAFAPGSKDLAVLCIQDACPDESCAAFRVPLKSKIQAARKIVTYKLVVFHRLFAKQKGHFYCSTQQESRDVAFFAAETVVDLALSPDGHACIVWKGASHSKGSLVWYVHRNNDLMESFSYDPAPRLTPVVSVTHNMHGSVYGAGFSIDGKSLDLYEAGHHIASYTTSIRDGDNPVGAVTSTDTSVDIEHDGIMAVCRRGPIFYSSHTHDARLSGVDETLCRWTDLFLLFLEPDDHLPYAHPSVFIASDETYRDPNRCDHTNNVGPIRSFGLSTKPCALLGGYRQGSSSLGTKMAISSDGTRIGASVWNCIYLWSFNPKLLAEGELNLYFPPQDYNGRKGFGRLRPTLLSTSAGVVHSLFWASEEILYAITDRGLSKFDINSQCEGVAERLSLTWDTWAATALSEPAPGAEDRIIPPTIAQRDDEDDEI